MHAHFESLSGDPGSVQVNETMQRSVGVQKARRIKAKATRSSQAELSTKYFPSPTAPGQAPRLTALSPNPCYCDELFDKYPPPQSLGWTDEDLHLLKLDHCGIRMLRPSPTMEQLRAWGVDSYEEFCILNTYYLP